MPGSPSAGRLSSCFSSRLAMLVIPFVCCWSAATAAAARRWDTLSAEPTRPCQRQSSHDAPAGTRGRCLVADVTAPESAPPPARGRLHSRATLLSALGMLMGVTILGATFAVLSDQDAERDLTRQRIAALEATEAAPLDVTPTSLAPSSAATSVGGRADVPTDEPPLIVPLSPTADAAAPAAPSTPQAGDSAEATPTAPPAATPAPDMP